MAVLREAPTDYQGSFVPAILSFSGFNSASWVFPLRTRTYAMQIVPLGFLQMIDT